MTAPTLPPALRALAESLRVASPDYEWAKFLGRTGQIPERNLDERWARWLKTAKKKPDPEAEAAKPRGSTAPNPHAVWSEPDEWVATRDAMNQPHDERSPACPCRACCVARAKAVLDALNAIGGPKAVVEPPKPAFTDPLCACGRICALDAKSCGECKPKPERTDHGRHEEHERHETEAAAR